MAVSLWLYSVKPVIADYYYMKVDRIKKLGGGCHSLMKELNNTIRWHPYSYYYQEEYLVNALGCFTSGNKEDDNLEIKNNIELIIS